MKTSIVALLFGLFISPAVFASVDCRDYSSAGYSVTFAGPDADVWFAGRQIADRIHCRKAGSQTESGLESDEGLQYVCDGTQLGVRLYLKDKKYFGKLFELMADEKTVRNSDLTNCYGSIQEW